MTIKQKDLQPYAKMRPEVLTLANDLLASSGVRDGEHFSYVSVGLVFRNQGWRECLVTGRITNQNYLKCRKENKPYKDAYLTYRMPNGKLYKTAFDSVDEYMNLKTLKLAYYPLDEHISLPV